MTDINVWRSKLFRKIEQVGLLRQPRQVNLNNGVRALAGRIEIEGRSVEIAINVDSLWYHRLPKFFLRPKDALGFIPHIDSDGIICFLEEEGIIFNRRRPLDVVCECCDHVQRTLREGVTGVNRNDFVDEFEVYWARLNGPMLALANLELLALDHVTEVYVGFSSSAQPGFRITHDAAQIWYIPNTPGDRGPWNVSPALYLPLASDTLLVPPQAEPPFWGTDGIQRLLQHCSPENREHLENLLCKRSYSHRFLITRLPRPSGDAALFGVRFEELREQHPLANDNMASAITPIIILRRDRHYLVQRGGGQVALAEKRILLIGCGAIGGHIALELARAGVEQLHLVDPDTLEPENTHRHVLGKKFWGTKKAVALEQALRAQLPFSKAKSFVETIEQLISSDKVDLCTYDLIVSAIGNPTSELGLNERVWQTNDGPPIIFAWVDPYGIGGHAVLTGLTEFSGCFECLYTQSGSHGYLYNRASFAAPGQVFRQSIAGCQNLYTPYGSLDAAQTAQLASRLAVDTLLGRVQENRVRSWKGDSSAFIAEGFDLSPRYRMSLDQLEQLETSFASDDCPVCRMRQSR
jgi:molybdopterin/thiamine biosynthesis adenylyltransferase